MATFGSLAAVTTGTASAASFSPVTTTAYTISGAASSVSAVTAVVSPTTPTTLATYTLKFTTPGALVAAASGNSAVVISITTSAGGNPLGGSPSAVGVADASTGYTCSPTATFAAGTTSTLTVPLTCSGTINAGDQMTVTFTATNATVTAKTTLTFSVTTTSPTETSGTASATIAPTTIAAVSAPSPGLGVGETVTYNGIELTPTAATYFTVINLQACTTNATTVAACTGAPGSFTFSSNAASYAVTDTTTSTSLSVSNVTTTAGGVALTLANPGAKGNDVLTIAAVGTNPNSVQTDYFVAYIATGTFGTPPTNTVGVNAGSVNFGASVSNVTVTPSNTAASATGVTYTVGWKTSATGAMATGGTITFVAPDGACTAPCGTFYSVSGLVVSDSTTGASQVLTSSSLTPTATTNPDDTLPFTTSLDISASDSVAVVVFGVTNPVAGVYSAAPPSGFSVSTSADPVAADAASYTIGASTVSSLVTVTVTPNTPGSLATYVIATLKAADALVSGTDTIEIKGPGGTDFPGSAVLTDSTTSADSQTLTASSGTGTNDVVYKLGSNIAAGDALTITMSGVVNPSGGSYTLTLGADNATTNATAAGVQGLGAPALTFPGAGLSYPNGSIVFFGGTAYAFAGGKAFGIPTPTVLGEVAAADHSPVYQTAPTGATVPTAAARAGALFIVYGGSEILVVGTDGDLYGFASLAQLQSTGYDVALVTVMPNLGGMTVSSESVGAAGTAQNALATAADGAIVWSSGTAYVFAGGKAFGIPTPTTYLAILGSEPAGTAPLSGAVASSALTKAIATGVLVTLHSAVYVTYGGNLYPFKSPAMLSTDGYGGTPSVVIPNFGGLSVASYTGS